jgi:hypothetical protein
MSDPASAPPVPAAADRAIRRPTAPGLPPVPVPERWHRPLLVLASAMAVLALATAVLAIADPREILGQNAWFKPLKFALSIAIYAVTLAWMLAQLRRFRRVGHVLGTVSALALLAEIAIIVGAAAVGTTSHFNVATPLSATLWAVMGASIAVVWLVVLAVGIALLRSPLDDPARTLAVRAGVAIGVVGMAVAFFMTSPNAEQLRDFQGVAGAHAVGVADGGPGLPFLGWSTQGGDLRAPHFVGMHALQALPLFALGLELASRRVAALRDARVRFRLVLIATVGFGGAVTLLTWQALAGQPVTAPSGAIPVVAGALAIGCVAAAVATIAAARRGA